MSNLLIRDVTAELKAELQRAAELLGRSADEHARCLLIEALGLASTSRQREALASIPGHPELLAPEIEHIELVEDQGPAAAQGLREHTRVEYGDIKARFSEDGSTKLLGLFTRYFSCDVIDISVRGARIRTSKKLREHEAITLYFSPPCGEKISIHGKVVRVMEKAAGHGDYGVQFLDVLPQGELRSIICQKVIEQKFHD